MDKKTQVLANGKT